MKIFRLPFTRFGQPGLVLVCLLCLSAAPALTAPPAYAVALQTAAAREAGPQTSNEQASGEDAYRHSASVHWLAKAMHVDDETAARIFEYSNFAIIAAAILFALLKYLPKTFRENREKIKHQLVDARTATQQANDRLAAIEQRLGHLDEEIAAIGKQAEKDTVEDEARIKASIEAERKRIVDSVTRDIAAAGSAAQRELKRFAAGLAVDRATQRITLSEDDDHALMQEFAQSLAHETRNRGES